MQMLRAPFLPSFLFGQLSDCIHNGFAWVVLLLFCLFVCFCFISKRFIKTRPNCKMKRIWTFNGLMVGFSTGLSRRMNWLLPTFDLWWACEDNPAVSKTEFLSSENPNTNSYSLSSAQGYIPFEFSNCVGFLDSTMNQTNYKRKLLFST